VHLPLVVPDKSLCRIRVGDETRNWEEGKVLVFDDSFEHEAWNDAELPRVVLIFDVWHPELSTPEVKLLDFLTKTQMRAEKVAIEREERNARDRSGIEGSNDEPTSQTLDASEQEVLNVLRGDNLYSIIAQTRSAPLQDNDVWGS